jgi:hypothetical protein
LEEQLEELLYDIGEFIILGDINLDFMQDTFYIKKYKEILYKHGLHQIITKPTRETANSSTIIDHVITRLKNLEWKVLKTPRISDHYIIFLSLPIKIENYEILIEKINYKEYDKEAFQ